jgi:hypothetical protein
MVLVRGKQRRVHRTVAAQNAESFLHTLLVEGLSVTPGSSDNRLWLLSCLLAWLALGGVLVLALCQRAGEPVLVDQVPQRDEPVASMALDGRVDPNTAEWYDLTRLPRVGESLARRIVAYRQAKILEWQSHHSDAPEIPPVFVKPEDLLAVKGIGPKTLERIQPFLRLPVSPPATQAGR